MTHMLHHVSLGVAELARAAAFYDAALGPLGYRRVFEDATAIGYGVEDGKDKLCLKLSPAPRSPASGFHLAFAAPSRAAVDRFHGAGLAAGGTDNGLPGLRPAYGEHYYAAFVVDPDGHHLEAVVNAPASKPQSDDPVLVRGVRIVAEIRHSHGIKAALAIGHLHDRFPHWTEAFWHEALVRARWFEELVVERPVPALVKEISPQRARVLLARSVVPLAYTAVRSWAAAKGADDIVRFYLEQAAANPQYLGHHLSILLALGEAWPIYKDSAQQDLYLDRLTEFILACRFGLANEREQPTNTATWNEACTAVLARPGFFGHHLICLAWIGRSRAVLSERQMQSALGWAVAAAGTTYPDAEDNVEISPVATADLTDSALEAALRELLLGGKRNIHLLTLADAIAWLWDDLDNEARPYLIEAARQSFAGDAA